MIPTFSYEDQHNSYGVSSTPEPAESHSPSKTPLYKCADLITRTSLPWLVRIRQFFGCASAEDNRWVKMGASREVVFLDSEDFVKRTEEILEQSENVLTSIKPSEITEFDRARAQSILAAKEALTKFKTNKNESDPVGVKTTVDTINTLVTAVFNPSVKKQVKKDDPRTTELFIQNKEAILKDVEFILQNIPESEISSGYGLFEAFEKAESALNELKINKNEYNPEELKSFREKIDKLMSVVDANLKIFNSKSPEMRRKETLTETMRKASAATHAAYERASETLLAAINEALSPDTIEYIETSIQRVAEANTEALILEASVRKIDNLSPEQVENMTGQINDKVVAAELAADSAVDFLKSGRRDKAQSDRAPHIEAVHRKIAQDEETTKTVKIAIATAENETAKYVETVMNAVQGIRILIKKPPAALEQAMYELRVIEDGVLDCLQRIGQTRRDLANIDIEETVETRMEKVATFKETVQTAKEQAKRYAEKVDTEVRNARTIFEQEQNSSLLSALSSTAAGWTTVSRSL